MGDAGADRVESSLEESIDALVAVLEGLAADRRSLTRRADRLRQQLRAGRPLSEIVGDGDHPQLVQSARDANARLTEAYARFSRASARALYREGLSMERIGALFGVSRQRVADLLRTPRR